MLFRGTITYQNVLESATHHDYEEMHKRNAGLQFDDVISLQFTSVSSSVFVLFCFSGDKKNLAEKNSDVTTQE